MGCRNVEPFTLSGFTAEQYAELLREYRLKASGRHVDVGTPGEPADIAQILQENRILGVNYFGSGGTPRFTTEAEWVTYAEYLDTVGAQARQAGQWLMVHNHNWEFETTFGDRTAFDILMQHSERRHVASQLDLCSPIFRAAGGSTRYFVVEHDPRFGDPSFDPFEAAQEGFAYLTCTSR